MANIFFCQRALSRVSLRKLQYTLAQFRRAFWVAPTLNQRRTLSIGQYLWVCISGSETCYTSSFYFADLYIYRLRHGMISEWRLHPSTFNASHPWKASIRHKPPTEARHINKATDTQGFLLLSSLNTPASLLFDISEIDRTWVIRASYGDAKYLLNFCAVFGSIRSISTTSLPVWIRVRVTSHKVTLVHLWVNFEQTAKSWNLSRFLLNRLPPDCEVPLSQLTMSTSLSIAYRERRVATSIIVAIKNRLRRYENGI